MGESQISIEMIKNIFTEMFPEQYERQESLFKSHEETILSIISSNTKITTQQLDKFNEKIEEDANRIERLEKQNYDFSEFKHFSVYRMTKSNRLKRKLLQEHFKSVDKDIECKHKEFNLNS